MQQQSVVRSHSSRSVAGILAQLLLLACVFLPTGAFAVGQPSTYPGCQTRNVTVAWGGTVPVNMSTCHFFGLGTIRPGFFPSHGNATPGPQPVNIYNYQHNGSTPAGGGTDVFHVLDDNSDFIIVTVTIQPPSSPISVSPASLPVLRAGEPVSQALSSSGGLAPYTYTLQSGTLPLGLSLSGGVISGTPTQRGPYSFTVRSRDSTTPTAQFTDKGYSDNVLPSPISLVPASTTAIQNVAISQSLNIVGGLAPHSCLLESGSFPSGISVTSGCVITGTTAAAPGNFPVTIRVTDASTGPGSFFELENFTLVVSPPPSVSIAVSPASVNEDQATNLTYTVTRSALLSIPTVVNISTGGTATSGTDYTGAVTTVTIPAGATTATITIDPSVDGAVEPNETVTLSVTAGTGYTIGTASATGTILNDDVPTATIAVAPSSVLENGPTNLVYTVTLNQANPSAATTVNYTIGGTATNGADYATIASPLVINAGNTSGTITVDPTGDPTIEANETVTLSLAAGAGYAVGIPNNATGTITNDDLPSMTISSVTADEGNSGTTNFTFTVFLSLPAGPGGVTFDIATANNTATAGSDYVANALTGQTIPEGSSTYNFTVQVNGDTLNEASEIFSVNVTNVTGATSGATTFGTIRNDDPLPSLSINDVSVTEGNSGTTSAVFAVTLNAASGQTVQVNYATANGTATQPADYASNIGTLTFTPGQTTQPITVLVQGDAALEPNETYFVNLSGANNATISDNQGLGTIVDDECPSTVVTNGNDSGAGSLRQIIADACVGSTITFAPAVSTVTLTTAELLINKNLTIDGGSALVTVTRSTAGGTPQFRIFNVQSGNIVSMNALVVSNGNHPVQAGGIENNGSLTLTNMHITGNRAPQSGGIQNNSVLNLSNSSVTNNVVTLFGGGLAAFGPSTTTTLSNCTFTGNQADSDTGAIGAGGTSLSITSCTISGNTLVIPGGVGAGITVNGVPTTIRNTIVSGNTAGGASERNIDGSLQAASAFNVLGAGPAGGLINGTNNNQVGVAAALLGTLGNYGGLTPTLPLLPGSVAINAGTNVSTPTSDQRGIARPQLSTVDVGAFESRGFNLAISGGNAQSALIGAAFTNPLAATVTSVGAGEPVQGGRVTFTPPVAGAGATLATSPATINASGVASVNATANTTIGSYAVTANANGNLGGALSFALQNTAPGLSINDVSQSEGNGGTSTFTFTVSLSAPAGVGGVSFDIATANSTATSGSDYVASSLTGQTIAAGNSSRTFVVTVNGDTTFEATETFFVNVTNVTGASVTDGQGLGTINNDDVAPTLTINAPSVTEGNAGPTPMNFIVSLSEPSGLPVNFNFATGTGTATAGADYVAMGSTAGTIAPGGTGASVNVTINGDTTPEANETVVLNLTGITGATPASLTGTGTINDDDVTTVVIEDASLTEGNSGTQILIFNVDRSSSAGAFTVDFATSSGTATAGSDFTSATGTLTFPAGGALRQTVVVTTIGDLSVEANETFNVTLSNLVNSSLTASITDNTGVGTITDNDSATVQFVPTSLSQSEATSPMAFTVTLSNPVQSGVTLTVNSTPGTATAADFTAISAQTVTFPANSTTAQTVNVVIANDSLFEGSETYTLALSNLVATGNVTLPPGAATATGTITNDDDAPTITISAPSVVEGNPPTSPSLNFVVSLNTASGLPVNFNFATNGPAGTATAGTDYTAIAGSVGTIAAGGLSVTLPVTVLSDTISEANETVVLALSGISNANVTTLSGTGTINDDDVAQITINDVGLTEGDSGSQNLQFTVSRSGSGGTFSVDFATSNATATAGSDYTSSTGTLNFTANGTPSQVINVPITGESLVEAAETFTVTLSNVVNTLGTAAIDDGSGTGTITDNDSATVQFAPTSLSQSEATSPMAFTMTLSNPVQSGVTLTVNTTPGTATAADFTAITNGTVSFAANSTTAQTVNVAINGDALDEDDESFGIALSNLVATGAVSLPAGTASATGTIVDDDALPVLSITSPSQPEGNSGSAPMNFVVTLAPASGRAVSFTRATADGSATVADNDYVALAAQAVTIPAGQTSVSIPVTINGDAVFEGNQTFALNLTGIANATPGSLAGTGTILDDDQQPTTTEITSDNPDPSPVNTPYTVAVTVRGATSSPTGTVTVDDGTGASCGPVALVAGAASASTASCAITSTTPGTKTLTATYTPSSTAFGASTDTEPHTVIVVAPALAYAPTTGTTVTHTGVTTTGTTGTATIALTPSGGAGTGAAATTSVGNCVFGGADAASFALGTVTLPLAFEGATTTVRNLPLTCTASDVARSATLTCDETRGTAAATPRSWPLSCPAGTPLADLGITGSVSPNPVNAGTNLTYALTATNAGPSVAQAVQVSLPLPTGTGFVSVTQTGATCTTPAVGAAGTVTCTWAGATTVGQARTLTVVASVPASTANGTALAATATTTSSTPDPATPNNTLPLSTTVATASTLAPTLTATPNPVVAGTNVTWTASATKAGPSDAQGVQLSLPLPATTRYVSATASTGGTCTTPAVGATGTVTCTWAGATPPTILRSVDVVAQVQSSATGTLAATVSASSTTNPTPVTASTSTAITTTANLQLGLTASPTSVNAGGGVITYVATATNTGPSDAPALTITVPFPIELGVTSAVASAGGTCSGTSTVTCTWPGATAPGESRTATITAVVQVSASRTLFVTASANSGATVTAATATTGVNIAAPIPVDDPRALLLMFAAMLLLGGAATRRMRAGTAR